MCVRRTAQNKILTHWQSKVRQSFPNNKQHQQFHYFSRFPFGKNYVIDMVMSVQHFHCDFAHKKIPSKRKPLKQKWISDF